MQWFTFVIKILPFIFELMKMAEKAFRDKPKSGEEKKELVMEGAEAVIGGIVEVSTGGQKETWEEIKEPVSNIIDYSTDILFNRGKK